MTGAPVGTRFSKGRLEALSDGVFAIAMTLLVLELKVPDLPRHSAAAVVLPALRHEGPAYVAFAMSFLLAGQFWLLQHVLFHYLQRANRLLAILTLLFLMFVSLLPYSTKMLTALGLEQTVAEVWYFGNQWVLAALIASHGCTRDGPGFFQTALDDGERRQFEIMVYAQPIALALPIAMAMINPRYAYNSLVVAFLVSAIIARRASARKSALAT